MQRMFQLALPQPIDECLVVLGELLVADAGSFDKLAVCLVSRKAVRDTSVCPLARISWSRPSRCKYCKEGKECLTVFFKGLPLLQMRAFDMTTLQQGLAVPYAKFLSTHLHYCA